MRLQAVRGVPVGELPEERQSWATRWDYSATYRDRLRDSEKIIDGTWVGRVAADTDPVPISIDEQVTDELDVGIGSRLTFDVQGIPLETEVASIRRIEWEEAPPNFFVVFPAGALEAAPQFHVLVADIATQEDSAAIQRRLVRDFPNVAIIDLKFVMQTIDDILGEITFIIRFMASFSVVTGLIVLIAAVATSRAQRIRESVLLRTLGAKRAQIYRILIAEYAFLGIFAALTGVLLSLVAAWGLTRFLFEVRLAVPVGLVTAAGAAVIAVTIVIGLLSSRGVCSRSPLEVLRAETT